MVFPSHKKPWYLKKKKICPKLGWNHFTSSQTSWEQPTPPTVSALTWEVGDTSKSLLWMGQIRDLTEVFSHPRWGPWPLGYSNMVCPGCENSSQGEFHQTSSVSTKKFWVRWIGIFQQEAALSKDSWLILVGLSQKQITTLTFVIRALTHSTNTHTHTAHSGGCKKEPDRSSHPRLIEVIGKNSQAQISKVGDENLNTFQVLRPINLTEQLPLTLSYQCPLYRIAP